MVLCVCNIQDAVPLAVCQALRSVEGCAVEATVSQRWAVAANLVEVLAAQVADHYPADSM